MLKHFRQAYELNFVWQRNNVDLIVQSIVRIGSRILGILFGSDTVCL